MTGATGATGATGPTGPTGPTGATGPTGPPAAAILVAENAGPITIFDGITVLNAEDIRLLELTSASVTEGKPVKIDFALSVEVTASTDLTFNFEVGVYRDGNLIETRELQRSITEGTHIFPMYSTCVDEPANSGTATYDLRSIFTSSNTATVTVSNMDLNVTVFY